ncbi:hypothetical protein [Streptomyces sp. NPDC054765]
MGGVNHERFRRAGQGNLADRAITRTLEPEGRGARLFLVPEGFDPGDPYQVQAHRIMAAGRRSAADSGGRPGKVRDEL